ncbi:hypothetical protein V1478_014638 [Vespula squamosa]|uniref:Uncharacterized protein n=1 Tax=Vespula squamosa TaxID=30214 RepID=A0ABD2A581_VESSQ
MFRTVTSPSIRSEISLFANLAGDSRSVCSRARPISFAKNHERNGITLFKTVSLGMTEVGTRSAPPKEDDGSLALDRTLVFHEKRRSTGLIHEARLNNAIETLTST